MEKKQRQKSNTKGEKMKQVKMNGRSTFKYIRNRD